jgi:hypothetical protein
MAQTSADGPAFGLGTAFKLTAHLPSPKVVGNISTRARVDIGSNVLIAGFIIDGTQPKKVIVRALGPP